MSLSLLTMCICEKLLKAIVSHKWLEVRSLLFLDTRHNLGIFWEEFLDVYGIENIYED